LFHDDDIDGCDFTFCIVLLTVTAMEQRKFEIRYFKFEPEARLEFLLFELVIGD